MKYVCDACGWVYDPRPQGAAPFFRRAAAREPRDRDIANM